MGDCFIRLHVDRKLVETFGIVALVREGQASERKENTSHHTFSFTYSADSTVHDAISSIKLEILNGQHPQNPRRSVSIEELLDQKLVLLWNCSQYPTTNVSDDWRHSRKNETLYTHGLFPSCQLYMSGTDLTEPPSLTSSSAYDDIQYNTNERAKIQSQGRVVLLSYDDPSSSKGSDQLPSQVLQSVTRRFDDDSPLVSVGEAKLLQLQNKEELKRKRLKRFQNLESRIRKLEQQQNQSSTSNQVRKMLIKSRATGKDTLREDDRIYFHCIIQDGDDVETKEDYRFYSRLDTFGRVLKSFDTKNYASEVLVKVSLTKFPHLLSVKDGESEVPYVRLPVLMQLHEAVNAGILDPKLDQIIIRGYNPSTEEATEIFDLKNFQTSDTVPDILSSIKQVTTQSHADSPSPESTTRENLGFQDQDLYNLIRSKLPKKASASIEKVRQMKMKSNAQGDSKRVKMEDRLFIELIETRDKTVASETKYLFLSKTDRLDRLLRDWTTLVPEEVDLLALFLPKEKDNSAHVFEKLELTVSVNNQASITNFARIVSRLAKG